MSRVSESIIVCAENIAIASLFHSIPHPPLSNPQIQVPPSDDRHTLSLDHERQIASTLAFLAHTRNDAEYIPAVCIEEDSKSDALNVVLAINKVTALDGNDVLHEVQRGFDALFALLAKVSVSDCSSVKDQIFELIVSMCSSRILSRLRLCPSTKDRMKRSFKDTLYELGQALTHLKKHLPHDSSLLESLETVSNRAKETRKALDSWSRHQVTLRLVEIVESIYRIQQIGQLQALLDSIRNIHMSPSARESMANIVGKISRYREAARFLYRIAKCVPLARKMRTVPVYLPAEAFARPYTETYTPDLVKKITEMSYRGTQQKLLKEICSVLEMNEKQAKNQFCRQVENNLKKAKIHAEVQIIAYGELLGRRLPRIICSSKDACFLCNLFIETYGKMYTPRSHGRLYPAWRLPCLPQLEGLEQRFCQALQNKLEASCSALLATRRRVLHPLPAESTLFTLPSCGTTSTGNLSVKGSECDQEDLMTGSELEQRSSSQECFHNGNSERQCLDSTRKSESIISGDENSIEKSSSTEPKHERASFPSSEINQGHKLREAVGPNGTCGPLFAGPFKITIEAGSSSHTVEIEWLSNMDTETAHETALLINVEEIHGEMTLDDNPLYMTARGKVLRLSWRNDGC
ncbi:nucleic acid/nucleotide deaminase domain-containing protein [Aspergillus homomorphus CBS 101889]|uniref:Uncharacterized protein n=1 Tax=Aspergillus homomorphus (strain CBS 101889) TaxID=1450537 RepID=A0A395HHU9_ASPHC|nr:hypothetical protein BO97DRAFT_481844 [Aspergillus homomorphus CBS 101889]RAL06558.1 hypothetical protein BO97DRAFT_481844 [Aspergillus homomorphus CBS 101889]